MVLTSIDSGDDWPTKDFFFLLFPLKQSGITLFLVRFFSLIFGLSSPNEKEEGERRRQHTYGAGAYAYYAE